MHAVHVVTACITTDRLTLLLIFQRSKTIGKER